MAPTAHRAKVMSRRASVTSKIPLFAGGAGFLDLLILVNWQASDGGAWASVTPVHLSTSVEVPELSLPDDRQAYGFNSKPNSPGVRIDKNVMTMELWVSCNAIERAADAECSESKRYRVKYERGELHVREVPQ